MVWPSRFIRRLNRDGHTIVLTTHYLEEAEALCERIAMLKAGRIVALDSTANLLRRFSAHALRFRLGANATLPAALAARAEDKDGTWHVPFDRFEEIEPLLAELRRQGCELTDLEVGKPDLEDVFVRVMHGSAETRSAA